AGPGRTGARPRGIRSGSAGPRGRNRTGTRPRGTRSFAACPIGAGNRIGTFSRGPRRPSR
ncbi:MAG TPA: hypothetical protein VHY77_07950, partial [Acidimicrobiales bacterium]|nr:hypothetical protein [Acidimicrobiales bacterium]